MVENAEKKILGLITGEPGYRLVFYKILEFCETWRSSAEVEEAIGSFPEMKTALHSPGVLMGWLEDVGGIERLVAEGEEEEEDRWRTTAAGQSALEIEAPEKRLLELVSKEPAYSQIYSQVLEFCQAPRKKAEIEEMLESKLALEKPRLFPAFFVNRLEEAGGLEWVDKHWRTTEAGKGVLE